MRCQVEDQILLRILGSVPGRGRTSGIHIDEDMAHIVPSTRLILRYTLCAPRLLLIALRSVSFMDPTNLKASVTCALLSRQGLQFPLLCEVGSIIDVATLMSC